MAETRVTNTKLIFGFFVVLYVSISFTFGADTISPNQIIRYNDTIVSPQEIFELGFFSPGNSMNHYVAIWYKKRAYRTVVWVANRDAPLVLTSGELTLTIEGVLVLRDAPKGNVVWNSTSKTSVRNPIGQLLDTGNFIIYKEGGNYINQENFIWQSFDFPTDTLLSGMNYGRNFVTGIDRHFTSWKSYDDPASGNFSYGIDIRGYPQVIIWNGPKIWFRGGPWNGLGYTGNPNNRQSQMYNFTFVINQKEIYSQFNLINTSALMRVVLQPNGRVERLLWDDNKQKWNVFLAPEVDQCDEYNSCGTNGMCNIDNSPVCECLKRFEPRSADSSQGCRRTIPLDCGPGEGFNKYSNLKLPDTRWSWYNQTMTLVECEKMCKSNCSCSAYTNSNVSGAGSGCLLWFGDLADIRTFGKDGDTLYIRVAASELDPVENRNRSSALGNKESSSIGIRVRVMVPIAFVVLVILISVCLFYRFNRKKQHQQGTQKNVIEPDPESTSDHEDLELPLFGLSTLLKATNNFSTDNKLGEGGYGPVYKGVLEDGKEIAVKRLAKTSTQGLLEFKNEVISISKLQHRNLVKLLGYCAEATEKMLVYEYMPNKSLDFFIFDKTQSELIDWPARYHIINGIARGLVYIHQDSRLRIIHRDLKASNILLDKNMNPKISDFGTARSFGGNQIEANTNRVVGTYGYMAPEYARDGVFSIKSDVYSFGVMILEIISGEKNRGFSHKEHYNDLMGHAWGLHNEGRSLELVAKCLGESIIVSQVLRTIHVGLLCVQRRPEDRPNMTSVILMLGSEGKLPSPKEPGFYVGEGLQDTSLSYGKSSNNELTISMLDGR
ncbi:G-type lectin S-receptor-like serine/threonine-protein kinase At4g27290 [Bidens hawaiensis]|uniref:G-type lectin S-receptor-like serine/threonine-protein kinase At4g27290 n=1 Tax=Bidens hawaiensis TaxID=980011 RepID=UPI00404A50EE